MTEQGRQRARCTRLRIPRCAVNRPAQPRGEQRGRGGRPRANQPSKEPPARSGTYSNSKPSCLLPCCKIYKRITSLNRLALETHMQTSHNTEELAERRAAPGSCARDESIGCTCFSLRWRLLHPGLLPRGPSLLHEAPAPVRALSISPSGAANVSREAHLARGE